jgi:hypothetical protein
MTFYIGKGERITDHDFMDIADKNAVNYAALRAVCEVEARNTGFTSANALICLYEPHIAYRYTSGKVRMALVKAGLAYPKQGQKPYPKTSYPRIDLCAKIAGEEIAATATSWGLPQMMGFNHKACGYDTALAMVTAFAESEYKQVEAMVKFIKSNPRMFEALAKQDWATFAKFYNGSNYAQNKYDQRLAKAYAFWKTVPLPEPEAIVPLNPLPSSIPMVDDNIDPPKVALANAVVTIKNFLKGIFT